MKKILRHFRTHILRGLLAAVPFVLTYFVIQFLFIGIDRRLAGKIEQLLGFRIPGLGIVLLVVFLYLFGLLSSYWMGRKALGLVEKVTSRIPLVRTVYQVGKQLSKTFSLPEHQVFKQVVLVEHFRPGLWSVGFVSGVVTDRADEGRRLLKVFIPTAPNPTSGFMVMVREDQVRELNWSASEALNSVVSAGIIGPEEVG